MLSLAPGAAQDTAATRVAGWQRIPIPNNWPGYTHAVSDGTLTWFLHGRDVEVLDGNQNWTHLGGVLPTAVDALSAVCLDRAGRIVVVPGRKQAGFVLDPKTRKHTAAPALALDTRRGAQVVVDDAGSIFAALGGQSKAWGRVVDGRWQALPEIATVTPLGLYSAGLFAVGHSILALGDHHVSQFDIATKSWQKRLFGVLGMRPALDRGGMTCHDREFGLVFMTLGKRSKTLGFEVTRTIGPLIKGRFYFLRPRLPVLLEDVDRTLYRTGKGPQAALNLLSRSHGAIFRIRTMDFHALGVLGDNRSDVGSPWETFNSAQIGSIADLCRERDSVCNDISIPPYFYNHRKNIIQRAHRVTLGYSHPTIGPKLGPRFATEGAAACYDGGDRIYLCNGYMRAFWALELRTSRTTGKPSEDLVPIADLRATRLRGLPIHTYSNTGFINNDNGGGNAALVVHAGAVYGLFDPVTRILWRYEIGTNQWRKATVLPADLTYTSRDGIDLFSYQQRLWVLTKTGVSSFSETDGWAKAIRIDLPYSSNGGMAALDPSTGMVYVVRGEGTADFATLHLPSGQCKLLIDYLPDVVSVYGRRINVTSWDGQRYVCIYRGHDTGERWRLKLPADGRL